jgi:hypothetical protein
LQISFFPDGIGIWNAVPGMTVCIAGGSLNVLTSSYNNAVQGGGVVTRVYPDANGLYIYIVTTLEFTTLPSWATNSKIYFFRNKGAKFIGCDGCDAVRQASLAYDNRKDYWEYFQYIIGGVYSSVLSFTSQFYGNLVQAIITPIQIGSAPGAFIQIGFSSFNSASNFAQDSGGIVLKIFVGVAGQRVLTQSAATTIINSGAGDEILLALSPVSALPTGRVVGGYTGSSASMNSTGVTSGTTTSPMAMIELFFETGIIRKKIPVLSDKSGNNNLVFGITGVPA